MKRLCSLLIITVLAIGTASAQSRFEQQDGSAKKREPGSAQKDRQRENRPEQREFKSITTIEGTLKLEKGLVALASGDDVYFVPMLIHYAGFIDGLKEGAKVSVEGFQFRNMLHPRKITLNGKDYDFPSHGPRKEFQGFRHDGRKDSRYGNGHHGHKKSGRHNDKHSGKYKNGRKGHGGRRW